MIDHCDTAEFAEFDVSHQGSTASFEKAQGSNQVEISVIAGRVLTLHVVVTNTLRLRCVRKLTGRPSSCIDLTPGLEAV